MILARLPVARFYDRPGANIQYLLAAIADMDYAEARLGSERIRGAYAWNSLLK
jgi:hypothetical protein